MRGLSLTAPLSQRATIEAVLCLPPIFARGVRQKESYRPAHPKQCCQSIPVNLGVFVRHYLAKRPSVRLSVISAALVVLAACVPLPTQEEVAGWDFGPHPADYERVVKDFYQRNLKDPDSAKYQNISFPTRYWLANRLGERKFGYLVCVALNAKNSYGAYTGYATDALFIRYGQVVDYIEKGVLLGKMVC
jgi:hypothetical protein